MSQRSRSASAGVGGVSSSSPSPHCPVNIPPPATPILSMSTSSPSSPGRMGAGTTVSYRPYSIHRLCLPPSTRYVADSWGQRLPHLIYTPSAIGEGAIGRERLLATRKPQGIIEKLAYAACRTVISVFNFVTRYDLRSVGSGKMSEEQLITRAVFLESLAAVPGMMAATVRHLQALRGHEHDNGWIRLLLEEADNERVHLFFFLREKPKKSQSLFFRAAVWFTQFLLLGVHLTTYVISPRLMHRVVGFLEEEAVNTYTEMLAEVDGERGSLRSWATRPAPADMVAYYQLGRGGGAGAGGGVVAGGGGGGIPTYRDVLLCVRADEMGHREYNHMFSDIHSENSSSKARRKGAVGTGGADDDDEDTVVVVVPSEEELCLVRSAHPTCTAEEGAHSACSHAATPQHIDTHHQEGHAVGNAGEVIVYRRYPIA